MNIDGFKTSIEQAVPNADLSIKEALEAQHNLSGLMSLLIKINEREQIVPTNNKDASHGN